MTERPTPPLRFAAPGTAAVPLAAVRAEDVPAWLDSRPDRDRTWLRALGFDGKAGSVAPLPREDGTLAGVAAGLGSADQRRRGRFLLAAARARLPAGTYALEADLAGAELEEAALGWLLAGYRFDRYAASPPPAAALLAPAGVDAPRLEAIAAGEAFTRDLINTPASDMGPDELEAAARETAALFGGTAEVTAGAALEAGFPLIHAVGRASARAPRLIDLRFGTDGPRLTLVGKGVCFDTGGLDIKPAASMLLMKKDMGGAAAVLGLARMLCATGARLRLRVLIPAVENAIAGAAFRPGDILRSRKGPSVEVNNTDAEGRLVLADALALAAEEAGDLTVSMATLTGAARVAVGPDLAPFFTDDEPVAAALAAAGARVRDPLWRLPFHPGYEAKIEPGIADLDNAPAGGMAGAITAALFLRRFAPPRYVHFDIYGWQPAAEPARPKGGVGQGTRALLEALPGILG